MVVAQADDEMGEAQPQEPAAPAVSSAALLCMRRRQMPAGMRPANAHLFARGERMYSVRQNLNFAQCSTLRVMQVWQPGTDAINDGETLQYDPTAYDCLHQLTFEWPSLRSGVLKSKQLLVVGVAHSEISVLDC